MKQLHWFPLPTNYANSRFHRAGDRAGDKAGDCIFHFDGLYIRALAAPAYIHVRNEPSCM